MNNYKKNYTLKNNHKSVKTALIKIVGSHILTDYRFIQNKKYDSVKDFKQYSR